MKAGLFLGPGNVQFLSVAEPRVGPSDVKIRVRAAGVCGTDIQIYRGGQGSAPVTPPVVLGHEFAGEVVEIGSAVTGVRVGDKVCVDPNMYCRLCRFCRIGAKQHCENLRAVGINADGGFAEYCVVPEAQALVLTDKVEFHAAALAEPLACCVHGIDRAGIKTGDAVSVIGAGAIGLMMVQLARLAGASFVLVTDPNELRRRKALEMGADYALAGGADAARQAIFEMTGSPDVDVVIECAGAEAAVADAFALVRRGGTVLLFSVPRVEQVHPLRLYDVFQKELTVKGSFINPDTQQRAVDLINRGHIRLAELVTDVFPLDEVEAAFQKQMSGEAVKVIVAP